MVPQCTWRSRTSDSIDATTNAMPLPPAATAVGPIVCPGISANSDTASVSRNAVSAAAARMRCTWAPSPDSRSAETEIGHEQQPDQRPATPALPRKKS